MALGTVLGALTGQKVVEGGRKLDLRIQKFVEENPDEHRYLARIASGFALLLPDGERLRDAALGARDDPEKLREYLREYYDDEEKRKQIDDAVHQVLSGDIEDLESELKTCFNTANVEEAQAMLLDFRDLIEARQVHQALQNTLDIEAQIHDVESELQGTRQQLLNEFDNLVRSDLRGEGFVRLTPSYFERDPVDFESALLSGFSLIEVREGYPIQRRKSDSSETVSEELFSDLKSGDDRTIVGPGGAGKSTVCKMVACRWYDNLDTGPVFYRESGSAAAFESVGTLLSAIQEADDHVLVAVEDVVRHEAQSIYEVVEECRRLPDVEVSFIFDARRDELHHVDVPSDLETGIQDRVKRVCSDIELYDLPEVDRDTCSRLIDQFERLTGRTASRSPSAILNELESKIDAGKMIHLVYFLPLRGSTEGVGLHGDVVNKFRIIHDPSVREERYEHLNDFDQELLEDTALIINIINASRLGVFPELIHCLGHHYGNEIRIHDQIEAIRSAFTGWMIHEKPENEFQIPHTTHEVWSILYLRELVEQDGQTGTRRHRSSQAHRSFARCVNAIFALFEDDDLEIALRREFGDSIWLRPLDEARDFTAYVSAAAIFELGTRWPVLTGLFESTDRSRVTLPSSPPDIQPHCMIQRGLMFMTRRSPSGEQDDIDLAEREFQQVLEMGDGTDVASFQKKSEASTLGNLGNIALIRGDLEKAKEFHQRALEGEKELGRDWGIAAAYGSLGIIYQTKGDLEKAQEYHVKALEIERSINDDHGVAETLSNLGAVEYLQSNFEDAETHLIESYELAEKLGNRRVESGALMNLSQLASALGDPDLAIERIRESLNIAREIGDTEAELTALLNKANLVVMGEDQDQVEEDLQYALELSREIGNLRACAKANGLLGILARERGDLDQAVEFAENGIELAREIGDVSTEADCLRDLGHVKKVRGEVGEGLQHLAEAIRIYDDIGLKRRKAQCLTTYGWALMSVKRLDEAEKYLEQALGMAHDVGDKDTRARCLGNIGLVSTARGDLERGRKLLELATREFLELDMYRWGGQSVEALIEVLEEIGDEKAVEEWRDRAKELGLDIDPDDLSSYRSQEFSVMDQDESDRTDEFFSIVQDPDVDYIPIGEGEGLFMVPDKEEYDHIFGEE